jgi:DNA invertase Pin-like site-specific DNA recombinase
MFAKASRKEFDMVLFWSLDRFSREGVTETLKHLNDLSSYGVEWFSFREEYLRSIGVFRDAVLAILAAVAKQERIRIQERVQAGLSRARAQGKVLGRPKAAVRHERVRELRDRGMSIRAIADFDRRQRDDGSAHPYCPNGIGSSRRTGQRHRDGVPPPLGPPPVSAF